VRLLCGDHNHATDTMSTFVSKPVCNEIEVEWNKYKAALPFAALTKVIRARVLREFCADTGREEAEVLEAWNAETEAPPRDYLLSEKFVRDLCSRLESDAAYHKDEAAAVDALRAAHPEKMFHFVPGAADDENDVRRHVRLAAPFAAPTRALSTPKPDPPLARASRAPQHAKGFSIGFTTPGSLGHLRKWGHNSTVLMDATAGTNKWKFHLTTLMVIDKATGTGIPVAWVIHKYEDAFVIRAALDALAKKVGGSDDLSECVRRFCPSYILIDACAKETKAVKECAWGRGLYTTAGAVIVPPARIMYCLWHVQRAWLKASKTVKSFELRQAMWRELKLMLQVKARLQQPLQHPVAAPLSPRLRLPRAGHGAQGRAVAAHGRVRSAVAQGARLRQVYQVFERKLVRADGDAHPWRRRLAHRHAHGCTHHEQRNRVVPRPHEAGRALSQVRDDA